MNYFHSGDLGDVIYALPAMRALGRGTVYLNTRPWTAVMDEPRVRVLKPLLEAQDYIDRVIHGDAPKDEPCVDISTFRRGGLLYGKNLMAVQSDWVNAKASPAPWLEVSPSTRAVGRIVCHRSPRYRNPYFRWDEIGKRFGERLLFVGLRHEVEVLRRQTGVAAEWAVTRDYLELAELIAGADLFIGNQSSPMALAIGLGVPFIQETCLWTPDCLYPRARGVYCYDGGILSLGIPSFDPPPDVDRLALPRGGWRVKTQAGGEAVFKSHRAATKFLMGVADFPSEEAAAQEVDRQAAAHNPSLVRRDSSREIFGKIEPLVDAIAA